MNVTIDRSGFYSIRLVDGEVLIRSLDKGSVIALPEGGEILQASFHLRSRSLQRARSRRWLGSPKNKPQPHSYSASARGNMNKLKTLIALAALGCGEAFSPDFFPPDAGGAELDVEEESEPPDADAAEDAGAAACEPETAVRHCGECQPGYYLSRLYDDSQGCLYLLRDCSVPCGAFRLCSWNRSEPCPAGWRSAGRLSTPECGMGSDAIDGHNTTACEPLE